MKRIAAIFLLGICMGLAWVVPAPAQTPLVPDMESLQNGMMEMQKSLARCENLIQEQNKRILVLEKNNEDLQARMIQKPEASLSSQPSLPPAPATASMAVAKPPLLPRSIGQGFNPDIGVVGDIVASMGEDSLDEEGKDRISVRELELVFGSYIDPYSRFDFVGTVGDFETFTIEEAYITHYGLPWGIKGELGRNHPKIGKAAAMHRDSLDTVDEPMVVARYFGEEGYFRTGVNLQKMFDLPWDVAGEVTTGLLEGGVGEGGTAFGETRRRPTFFSHLKTYKDLSDVSNAELGVTHMAGSKSDKDRFDVNVIGLDATWDYYVSPINKLKWQSEMYLQNRRHSTQTNEEGDVTRFSHQPWGFYSILDYRLTPRWELGARVDAVQPVDNLPGNRAFETGWSTFLTFHQSEFARWRFQLRHTDFASGGDDNTIFLQGTVAIGQHKHKLQ